MTLPVIFSNMASALSNRRISMLLAYASVSFFLSVSAADNGPSVEKKASYARAEAIPVSCLNRTTCVIFFGVYILAFTLLSLTSYMLDRDTGEHITTSQGELQYIPFSICNETNRPLELYFGEEKGNKNF